MFKARTRPASDGDYIYTRERMIVDGVMASKGIQPDDEKNNEREETARFRGNKNSRRKALLQSFGPKSFDNNH